MAHELGRLGFTLAGGQMKSRERGHPATRGMLDILLRDPELKGAGKLQKQLEANSA